MFCDQTANYSTPKTVEEMLNSAPYRWVLVSGNNTLSDYTGPKWRWRWLMKLKHVEGLSSLLFSNAPCQYWQSMSNYSQSAEKWLGFHAESTGTGVHKFRTPDGADNSFWTFLMFLCPRYGTSFMSFSGDHNLEMAPKYLKNLWTSWPANCCRSPEWS